MVDVSIVLPASLVLAVIMPSARIAQLALPPVRARATACASLVSTLAVVKPPTMPATPALLVTPPTRDLPGARRAVPTPTPQVAVHARLALAATLLALAPLRVKPNARLVHT